MSQGTTAGGTPNKATKRMTVAFYEIVDEKTGDRLPQVPWDKIVEGLYQATPQERVQVGLVDTLVAQAVAYDQRNHLVLARVRTDSEWMQKYNLSSGIFEDILAEAGSPFVAPTVVCFLEFGNVIGVIEGTRSSPRATQIEQWINGMGWVSSPISVNPVLGSDALVRLQEADAVSAVEFTARGAKLDRVSKRNGALASMFRDAREMGDVSVKMIITVTRGGKNSATRRALLSEVQEISEELGTGGAAKATLIYAEGTDSARSEQVNFLKQKVTAKKLVSAYDQAGKPVRTASAVRAIVEAADEVEDLLRAAIGLPVSNQK